MQKAVLKGNPFVAAGHQGFPQLSKNSERCSGESEVTIASLNLSVRLPNCCERLSQYVFCR
jgi:hypothetical protein